MDLKKSLEAKLLAVGALVLGLVLAVFVVNSYKTGSSKKSVITPAQATITPPAPAAIPQDSLPQGVATLNQNPINDTSVYGSSGNIPGNTNNGYISPSFSGLPAPVSGVMQPLVSAPFYPNF